MLEGDAPLLVLRRLLVILGNEKDGGDAGMSIMEIQSLANRVCGIDGWLSSVDVPPLVEFAASVGKSA